LAQEHCFSKSLLEKGDAVLRKTPFANQAWKFHTLAADHYLKTGRKKTAIGRLRKALAFYEHILENLPWPKVREYFQNQELAQSLQELVKKFNVKQAAPLPKIYEIFKAADGA